MDYHPPAHSLSWGSQAPDPEKTCQLLIRDYPHRAIAIVSRTHTLVFRHSSAAGGSGRLGGHGEVAKCMVEFTPTDDGMLQDYRPLTPRPIYGTLGLISMGPDVFLSVITQALRVATLRPGETVEMIQQVQFFCLNSNEYDDVLSVVDPWDPDADAVSVYSQGGVGGAGLSRRDVPVEHPCQELMKLLGNRSFYYSTDFDLTNRLQDRSADAASFDIDHFDEAFLWNSFMIQPLVQFRSRLQPHERAVLDSARILTSAVRGFCQTATIPQAMAPLRSAARSGMPSYLTVISRLSCRRAGTRFNARGIDDDGNVANFVETETVYWSPAGVLFSYVQVRGSVPVFWEQAPGLLPGHQKISITRSPDGAQPAFDKHFADLETNYGAVHVINLLSEAKAGEAELTACYRYGLHHCALSRKGDVTGGQGNNGHGKTLIASDNALLRATEYDFHAETKGPTGYEAAQDIRRHIDDSADGFAYYLATAVEGNRKDGSGGRGRWVVQLQQEGVFRTNCLDCLDRTNLIQSIISQMAVEAFLEQHRERAGSDFWLRHSNLWADNGDALSKIYAGTGALKSSFTRHGKMSLAGAIADARKSATRLYINNFADKGRQNTIDLLLGRLYGQAPVVLFDPISDYVTAELNKQAAAFSSTEVIKIWVGTFNVNGRLDGLSEDLSPWLVPTGPLKSADQLPEIVAIGFQEIVELSPQQIMNSDPTRKQEWEVVVRDTLNKHADSVGGQHYVLLRSGQLVGAALCLFVKASSLALIKNVEGSVKKTGLSGMAGNKGAVAIRLDYASTPICFVTAHLAAGFANYEERNRDYLTIHHGLRFQRNRGIDDHDAVLWFGDFNYRIGLGRDRALDLVRAHDLETLYENDQLNLQMVAGLAFPYYSEARITFPPTYRFDVGRDEYDTSEKQRIPAWTDRVLRKGANLRQTLYNSAPLRCSDHRPVYAHFLCTVNRVDEALRDKISRELYERRKRDVGDATANTLLEDTDDEDLIGYDAIEPGLPAASSDRQKWWLDNGRMAQAAVQPPPPANPATQMTILNPKRAPNPFVPSDEPDWVSVPRSSTMSSTATTATGTGTAAADRSRSRLSSFSSLSTSPYEHISHAAATRQETPPPPPPPRRQTGALTGSGGGGGGGGGSATPTPGSLARAKTTNISSSGTPKQQGSATPASGQPTTRAAPSVGAVARAFEELGVSKTAPPSASSSSLSSSSAPALPRRSATVDRPQKDAGRKLPPPVAKKPAHLSALSAAEEQQQQQQQQQQQRVSAQSTRTSARTQTQARAQARPKSSATVDLLGLDERQPSGNVDLLGDDTADAELSRWQALQPS